MLYNYNVEYYSSDLSIATSLATIRTSLATIGMELPDSRGVLITIEVVLYT